MKTLQTIKADLFNVFVQGNADKQQQARVFLLLFIPFFTAYMLAGDLR